LRAVTDGMLADPTFGGMVDRKRIGAAGFSLGGYTAITIAGGRTDLAAFDDYCSGHVKTCLPPPDVVPLLKQVAIATRADPQLRADLAHAGDSYRDERVRAIFAMAPAFGHSFAHRSLPAISIPVRIVAGDADDIAPADSNAAYFAQESKGARLDILEGGLGHFVFLAFPTAQAKLELPLYAIDPPGVDRAAIHRRVSEMAAEFFTQALR
jgi:predicted dienelactone hydrolase